MTPHPLDPGTPSTRTPWAPDPLPPAATSARRIGARVAGIRFLRHHGGPSFAGPGLRLGLRGTAAPAARRAALGRPAPVVRAPEPPPTPRIGQPARPARLGASYTVAAGPRRME